MTDNDVIRMMQRCREEILTLRNEIARLAPKADAYDSVRAVLRLLPQPSQGYGEDLAWKLEREIEAMKKAQAEPATEPLT